MNIDVIVPYFNTKDFLNETILSLISQNGQWIDRIIVVDDGSYVPATECLSNEALADPRVMVIRSDVNRGESHAVNLGWKSTRSRLIAVISADDPQPADWTQIMCEFITHNPGYVFYYPNRRVIDAEGKVLAHEKLRNFRRNDLLKSLVCVPSAGTIIDSSRLPEDFTPRDESIRYPSDLIQFLNLLRFGEGKKVPTAWGQWRSHKESLSSKTDVNKKLELFTNAITTWALANPDMAKIEEVNTACLLHVLIYSNLKNFKAKLKFARQLCPDAKLLTVSFLIISKEAFLTYLRKFRID